MIEVYDGVSVIISMCIVITIVAVIIVDISVIIVITMVAVVFCNIVVDVRLVIFR